MADAPPPLLGAKASEWTPPPAPPDWPHAEADWRRAWMAGFTYTNEERR